MHCRRAAEGASGVGARSLLAWTLASWPRPPAQPPWLAQQPPACLCGRATAGTDVAAAGTLALRSLPYRVRARSRSRWGRERWTEVPTSACAHAVLPVAELERRNLGSSCSLPEEGWRMRRTAGSPAACQRTYRGVRALPATLTTISPSARPRA
eukprot:scaffold1809_cov386-Prasinococcus_capsulatus_cf.AAC.18